MVWSRQFNLYNVFEGVIVGGHVDTAALLINMTNYTAEILDAIGDDKLLRVLIGFINLFSPHRFAAHATLLAALTPIHACLLQFLRQYIDLYYGSAEESSILNTSATISENTRITLTSDSKLIAFGKQLEAFNRLSADQRALLVSLVRFNPIRERVSTSLNSTRAAWLFSFCVEALNDVRVEEVSQNDCNMRFAASEQYTPLILELLSNFQLHHASPNSIPVDESTHFAILKRF